MTSSQVRHMAVIFSSVIFSGLQAWFAMAAAFFRMPNAWTTSAGMISSPTPMGKFSWDLCVCAPQYRSAGTAISPIESCSIL